MTKVKSKENNTFDHFFKGAFSIDIVLFTYSNKGIKFLLQKKKDFPIQNEWGLPGELIQPDQDTDEAMDIMLERLVGTKNVFKRQLKTFSDINRHPLGRIITIAYYGLIPNEYLPENMGEELKWVEIDGEYNLTLDHNKILEKAKTRFREGIIWKPYVFNLLPEKFVLSDLIEIYKLVFNKDIDVANFRKKILASKTVSSTGEYKPRYKSHGRPAAFYRYEPKTSQKLEKDGDFFNF